MKTRDRHAHRTGQARASSWLLGKGQHSWGTEAGTLSHTTKSSAANLTNTTVPSLSTCLVDVILCALQGPEDGLELRTPSLDALLQLCLLLLQPIQLRLGPVQVILLGLQV